MRRLLFVFLLALTLPVQAQQRHTHGEGTLNVVIAAERLSLELVLPLDAAVGFERPPRNDKEKTALVAAAKALQDAAAWSPTPAAQCALQSAHVHVPFTGSDDKHGQHAHEGETHHVDIEANYVFHCARPDRLASLQTTLFKSFPRLYRLEAAHAGPAGQGKGRLTPKKPVLNW